MKKVFYLLAFFSFSALNAQVKFNPTIRAGGNISNITNTVSNTKFDFYIGFAGEIDFTRFYSLQPELTYSRQGVNDARLNGNNFDVDNQYEYTDVKSQYIGVSLINKFKFSTVDLHFLAGPGFDIQSNSSSVYNEFDVDLTFSFGIGYEFENLGIEARYKKGLIDTYWLKQKNEENYGNQTNSVFQLGLYYKF